MKAGITKLRQDFVALDYLVFTVDVPVLYFNAWQVLLSAPGCFGQEISYFSFYED